MSLGLYQWQGVITVHNGSHGEHFWLIMMSLELSLKKLNIGGIFSYTWRKREKSTKGHYSPKCITPRQPIINGSERWNYVLLIDWLQEIASYTVGAAYCDHG